MPDHKQLKLKLQKFAPTILRFALGVVFLVRGYQKLFMQGFGGVGGFFAGLGIPLAMFFAYVVTIVEFLGGIFLILGILVRWSSALLAIVMAVATFVVHLPNGFTGDGGFEWTFVLFFALVSLMLSGPGAWNLYSHGCDCHGTCSCDHGNENPADEQHS
jgi:putative oxidoreductase